MNCIDRTEIGNAERLTEEEFDFLFTKYRETKSIDIRNQLVMAYSYIPKTVAIQLRGISQGYAQVDDMINQGVITLMDCLDRFDKDKGIKFEYYAFMRVRGGIIDLVRKQDWIPRRVRDMAKKMNQAQNVLSNELMREPTISELAEYMEISENKLESVCCEINNSVVFSFEELIQNLSQMGTALEGDATTDMSPEKSLVREEMMEALKNAINSLNEKERLVISLYYYENLLLADIASVLEVSVQRVSQIHTKAVSKLKTALESYIYG